MTMTKTITDNESIIMMINKRLTDKENDIDKSVTDNENEND